MSLQSQADDEPQVSNYSSNAAAFQMYLRDLADHQFAFGDYREGQGRALYRALEELYINDVDNVVLDLPTGVGKSPLNVALGDVVAHMYDNKRDIQSHFDVTLDLDGGNGFYTTPQKSLRNQLANDDDLSDSVDMLKSRADYTCGKTGSPCDSCPVQTNPEESCMQTPDCTYWGAKDTAMRGNIAAITFAMLIVDNSIPPETEDGQRVGFDDRDLLIVDEGHNLENQAASLFAGFTVSPYSLPDEVFEGAGRRADWDDSRFSDVERILETVARDCTRYIERHEEMPNYQREVTQCENFMRKYQYCLQEIGNDRNWVVSVSESYFKDDQKTKKFEIKPVDVDKFLGRKVWSRGRKRVISSATIPFRGDIDRWAARIGLPGDTVLISEDMPFPVQNRQIHTNTTVGEMSGSSEDQNWADAMSQIRQIASQHPDENGLIHTASYERAERVQDSLGKSNVYRYKQDEEQQPQIDDWVSSDKQLMVAPSMMEGVDLFEDRCRFQILLKVPYAYLGDSRVDFLVNEHNDWGWYMETASVDVQQSVGRAVRGPEASEASSYYVLDSKFDSLMSRTSPPDWFTEAITDDQPQHWRDSDSAPWR